VSGADAFLKEVLANPLSAWMKRHGPAADVALSSRIRLARNVEDLPFPHRMSEDQVQHLLDMARQLEAPLSSALGEVHFVDLSGTSPLDRQVLVEKHMISPLHAGKARPAMLTRRDASVNILVNEEDHFRIQVLSPGFDLDSVWELAGQVDDVIESRVDYAYQEKYGYLTACPTNVGTGLRASVMLHIPALVMTGNARGIFDAVSKVGIVVRGLYGEGSEGLGNMFQVSNQVSTGRAEAEIVANLKGVTARIIEEERRARKQLATTRKVELEDMAWRALGLLTHARRLSSEEAMKLLSQVRLGVDMDILKVVDPEVLNELLVLTRPANLQKLAGRSLTPEQRDEVRAELVRERLRRSIR